MSGIFFEYITLFLQHIVWNGKYTILMFEPLFKRKRKVESVALLKYKYL